MQSCTAGQSKVSWLICTLDVILFCRLPPAFNDVPTDVEYAMQLISQRVAAGLEIKPIKRDKLHQRGIVESLPEEGGKASQSLLQAGETPINWKKWGKRVALGKSAVSDISAFKSGNPVRSIVQRKHKC